MKMEVPKNMNPEEMTCCGFEEDSSTTKFKIKMSQNHSQASQSRSSERKKSDKPNSCIVWFSSSGSDTHSQGERAILRALQSKSNKRDMGNPDTSK